MKEINYDDDDAMSLITNRQLQQPATVECDTVVDIFITFGNQSNVTCNIVTNAAD